MPQGDYSFSYSDFKTRKSVLDAFFPLISKFEGDLPYMYTDSKGLVTTGVGNLIDPIAVALQLTWYKPVGTVATPAEVAQEWNTVKAAFPKYQSVNSKNAPGLIGLRLKATDVAALVKRRILDNEIAILPTYPKYGEYPADGQLGLMRMAWAGGTGMVTHTFANLRNAILKTPPDWMTAALQSRMKDWAENDARNVFVKTLFINADTVQKQGLDPSILYYPEVPKRRGMLRAPSLGEAVGLIALAGGVAGGVVYRDELGRVIKKFPETVRDAADKVKGLKLLKGGRRA
jgi:hypothetical protein